MKPTNHVIFQESKERERVRKSLAEVTDYLTPGEMFRVLYENTKLLTEEVRELRKDMSDILRRTDEAN